MREIKLVNGRKFCSRCGFNKLADQFYKSGNTKSGLTSACKQYKKEYERTEHAKTLGRNRYNKYLYGISDDNYNDCFFKQDGRCAICSRHQSSLKRRLDIDYDHKTGKFRGLLCNYCNKTIERHINDSSYFKDMVIIRKLDAYLRGIRNETKS